MSSLITPQNDQDNFNQKLYESTLANVVFQEEFNKPFPTNSRFLDQTLDF